MNVLVRFLGPKEVVLLEERLSVFPRIGEQVVIGTDSYRVFDLVWKVGEGVVPSCTLWMEEVP